MLLRQGLTRILVLAFLLWCAAPILGAEAPSTQPVGTIVGKVTSPSEVPLSEMVVYLESPDPQRKIEAPKQIIKVSQKGAKFDPGLIIICVGQTVDFLNDEDRPIEHNVFSNSITKQFDLGLFKPGESRAVTFDKPGAVFLYCSVHRHMDGVVFVSPTPFTSREDKDGHYKIEGVPATIWLVKTWQRRRRFAELSIPVLALPNATVTTDLELRHK